MPTDFINSPPISFEQIVKGLDALHIEKVAQSMVGKPEAEALVIARKGGFWLYISKRNGVGLPGIADARKDRICATVENGIITRTSCG